MGENKPNVKAKDAHSDTILRLKTDIDKLKAKAEAGNELRKLTNERFDKINETIGEIRTMLVRADSRSNDVEIAAKRATTLIKEVQPENLLKLSKKQDIKIDALKASIDSNEVLSNKIVGELKKIKSSISMFKGAEEIIKLNEEVKKELRDIKKLEAQVERHSDKVGNLYIDMQKEFNEFKKFAEISKNLSRSYKDLLKEIDKVKGKAEKVADVKQIYEIRAEINDKLIEVNKFMSEKMDEKLNKSEKEIRQSIDDSQKYSEKLIKKMTQDQMLEDKRLDEKFTKHFSKLLEHIQSNIVDIEEQGARLSEATKGTTAEFNQLSKDVKGINKGLSDSAEELSAYKIQVSSELENIFNDVEKSMSYVNSKMEKLKKSLIENL